MFANGLFSPANRREVFVLCLVNLSIPAFVLWQRHGNDVSHIVSIWSGWLSAIFLTTLFLFAMRSRRLQIGQRLPIGLILVGGALVVLSGLVTTIAISATAEHNNYLELAQSGIPLDQIEPMKTRLLVELIRRKAVNSAENDRIAASMKPISPPLYSIDSFASKEEMESASSQLKKAYNIDIDYAARQQQAMQDFRSKMLQADSSYLQSFDASIHDDEALEASISSDEQRWVSSALNLYEYAIAHADVISVRDDALQVADQEVRKSLLQQIDASKALQQTMMGARQKAVSHQQKLQNLFGLKPSK